MHTIKQQCKFLWIGPKS